MLAVLIIVNSMQSCQYNIKSTNISILKHCIKTPILTYLKFYTVAMVNFFSGHHRSRFEWQYCTQLFLFHDIKK